MQSRAPPWSPGLGSPLLTPPPTAVCGVGRALDLGPWKPESVSVSDFPPSCPTGQTHTQIPAEPGRHPRLPSHPTVSIPGSLSIDIFSFPLSIYLFFWAALRGMLDLRCLTRDLTPDPCDGNSES